MCNTKLGLKHCPECTQLPIIMRSRRRQEIFIYVIFNDFNNANNLPNLEARMLITMCESSRAIRSDFARRVPISGSQVYATVIMMPCPFAVPVPLLFAISPSRNLT